MESHDIWEKKEELIFEFYVKVLEFPDVNVYPCVKCRGSLPAFKPLGFCETCYELGFIINSQPYIEESLEELKSYYHINEIEEEVKDRIKKRKLLVSKASSSPVTYPTVMGAAKGKIGRSLSHESVALTSLVEAFSPSTEENICVIESDTDDVAVLDREKKGNFKSKKTFFSEVRLLERKRKENSEW